MFGESGLDLGKDLWVAAPLMVNHFSAGIQLHVAMRSQYFYGV